MSLTASLVLPPSTSAGEKVIHLRELLFGWTEGAPVLDIDDFTVLRGEKLFVAGPSGSGKSTLLSLLAGVLVPREGRVEVLGTLLSSLGGAGRDHFRADHIGFIFQLFNLIPYLSVLENVTLPCRFSPHRRRRVKEGGRTPEEEGRRLLAHLGLSGEEMLSREVTRLSVGQQQRVAAARALMGAPEILIADEPTSSLDFDRRQSFVELLFRECEAQRTTLVFVSHDRSLEALFDRTVLLPAVNKAASSLV